MTKLPDMPKFVCVGAARSGTTSFWWWCRRHPDIYVPNLKETNFFAHEKISREGPGDMQCIPDIRSSEDVFKKLFHAGLVRDLDVYLSLFDRVRDEKIIGEVSPSYLYYADYAAPKIKEVFPDAKILIFLRDPVYRAISQYELLVKVGREKENFETALRLEEERKRKGWEHVWHYSSMSYYYESVKQFIDVFGIDNVWIGFFDDLLLNPKCFYRSISHFLGVRDIDILVDEFNESCSVSLDKYERFCKIYDRALSFAPKKIGIFFGFFKARLFRRISYRKEYRALRLMYGDDVSKLVDLGVYQWKIRN